jgi:chromosome segregation and condensation protein ScpB
MASRLRPKNIFGERGIEQEHKSPKEVFVISIATEGKTEEQYFDYLSEMVSNGVIKIDRLIRDDEDDTKSHPMYVIELLEERIELWKEYGVEANELWMIIDRDKQNVSKKQLEQIIENCENKGFNLALSNPTFELWLLLHVTDLVKYDKNQLLENKKVTKKRRFIDKELSDLNNGYNKSKIKFEDFSDGIQDAIRRAKELEINNYKLIENLGTSVCLLVEKVIK